MERIVGDKLKGKEKNTYNYENTENKKNIFEKGENNFCDIVIDGIKKATSTKENVVEKNSNCYLTTACLRYKKEDFQDDCYELQTLRWFRDIFISEEDIWYYEQVAPIIVEAIDQSPERDKIYDYIYIKVIVECLEAIEQGNYDLAYHKYKNSVLMLEEAIARPFLEGKVISLVRNKIE